METESKKICPKCNYCGGDEDTVCPYCGLDLICSCPVCATPIRSVFAKYCYGCGQSFHLYAVHSSERVSSKREEKDN
jgi:hypothetical protein